MHFKHTSQKNLKKNFVRRKMFVEKLERPRCERDYYMLLCFVDPNHIRSLIRLKYVSQGLLILFFFFFLVFLFLESIGSYL
jgi:hypothetical protein